MPKEPNVYIALEDDAGQLVVKGPLSLLDRLVATMTGRSAGTATPAPIAASEAAHV